MTGGGGGHHRGRVTGEPGGAHWWGGRGPSGGGTHAAGARVPVLLVVVAVLAVGTVALGVAVTGTSAPPAPAAPSAGPPAAITTPGPFGPGTTSPQDTTVRQDTALQDTALHDTAAPGDTAALQDTVDALLATSPLRFPADSATPAPGASGPLDRLAAALRATPGTAVTVEGHTAPTGEDTGDAATLSRQRAEEIARRLEAAGVPADRLTPIGVGATRPLGSLAASRRVEIRVG